MVQKSTYERRVRFIMDHVQQYMYQLSSLPSQRDLQFTPFLQVHAFKVMMRKAVGEKKMVDTKISSSDLQDLLPQYQDALDTLRQLLK